MLPSFRDFILHKLDDSVTAEEAFAQYSLCEKEALNAVMESLRTSGLLYDLYNPAAMVKQGELVTSMARLRASKFVEDMGNGRFTGLRLLLADTSIECFNGMLQLVGHLQVPHFAFDPNVNAVKLSQVDAAISVWDLYEILLKQPGLLSTSNARFSDDGISRTYYTRFQNSADADSALKVLASFQPKDGVETKQHEAPCFKLADASSALDSFVLPPVMSYAERIEKDLGLATQIVCKLDGLFGIPDDVTNALVSVEGSTELKLDLQLMYLRRVHCFCFYSCQWCNDEWELRDRCGAVFLRSSPETSVIDAAVAAGNKWAQAHDARIQEFLASASFEKASLPSVDEEPLKDCLAAEIDLKISEVTQEKYQCLICGKYFRNRNYAQKHIKKMHIEVQDSALRKVCNDIVASAYLADPKRPGWPPAKPKVAAGAGGGA